MDKKGLKLISYFALSAGCRLNTSCKKLKECVYFDKCDGVEEELEKFPALNPFLNTLSEVTNLPKYSYDIGEAYWLGNDLLKQFKPEHYNILLKYFKEQGATDFYIDALKNNPPKKFIPTHLFKVLHIDRTGNTVPVEASNDCMIRWGRVTDFSELEMFLKLNSLNKKENNYELYIKDDRVSYDKHLFSDIKVGDTVAVHRKQVVKILTEKELNNLENFTFEILRSLF